MAGKKAKAALENLPLRNPIAANPLLSKSVVHEKSAKARRSRAKAKLKKEWYPQSTGLTVSALSIPFLALQKYPFARSNTQGSAGEYF